MAIVLPIVRYSIHIYINAFLYGNVQTIYFFFSEIQIKNSNIGGNEFRKLVFEIDYLLKTAECFVINNCIILFTQSHLV